MSSSTVSDAWESIHNWLADHAPKILTNLNPPASEEEIRDAEKQFGHEMPEDWRELYRHHNGLNDDSNQGNLFYGMNFLTLERVDYEHAHSSTGVNPFPVQAADPGIRKDDIDTDQWIALAHDYGDTLLRVDMNPGAGGTKGQVIFTDHAFHTAILMHKSVGDLLTAFAADLEAERYVLNEESLADGDHFLNCIPEIDVVNWSFSPRWNHLAR